MLKKQITQRWLTATILLTLLLVPSLALAEGSDVGAFSNAVGKGSLVAIAISFGCGFLASLTPCVFPMVPITVSIFGASEAKSRLRGAALSATFCLGIAALFVPLGMTFALSGKLMGSALSNPYVMAFISLVFAALAASMFGAFEIALPASLNNKLSTAGGLGFRGAFVIGLVMGLVAAPCTGPFLTGMVLWISTTQNVALGAIAMFAFAMGLGVPFFVAGTFAVNMPKGGAWMMGIKWLSGVVLAGFSIQYAAKGFPKQLGFLMEPGKGAIFIGFALVALGAAGGILHVMGERRKSPLKRFSKPSKLASILPAVAGVSLMMNGGLSMVWEPVSGAFFGKSAIACSVDANAPPVAWSHDETESSAKSRGEKKPMIIDIGATWCAACNELDEKTWPNACFRTEASRWVSVKVDGTDDESEEFLRIKKKYGPFAGLPVVILVDSEGKEAARFTEFVTAERMVATMTKVK